MASILWKKCNAESLGSEATAQPGYAPSNPANSCISNSSESQLRCEFLSYCIVGLSHFQRN